MIFLDTQDEYDEHHKQYKKLWLTVQEQVNEIIAATEQGKPVSEISILTDAFDSNIEVLKQKEEALVEYEDFNA